MRRLAARRSPIRRWLADQIRPLGDALHRVAVSGMLLCSRARAPCTSGGRACRSPVLRERAVFKARRNALALARMQPTLSRLYSRAGTAIWLCRTCRRTKRRGWTPARVGPLTAVGCGRGIDDLLLLETQRWTACLVPQRSPDPRMPGPGRPSYEKCVRLSDGGGQVR
jgi:hypothetical protein